MIKSFEITQSLDISIAIGDKTIPTSWRKVQLGDENIAYTASGGTPNRSVPEYFGGNVRWVKSGELKDGYIYDTEEKITQLGLESSSAKIFPAGTLLVAMYGATVGMTGILAKDSAINQAICAIEPNKEVLDSKFLQFYFIANRSQLLNARSGGAQPNINQRIIRDLNIAIPPLPEQSAIAHILQSVQNAIQARRKELELERERKAALMRHLLTYGTRGEARKLTEIGSVPESWSVMTVGDVVTLQRGFDITRKEQRPGKISVVSSSGILSYHDTAKVDGSGVIIGRKGSLGTAFYVEESYWPHDTTLWVKDFHGNYPKFVYYFLKNIKVKHLDVGSSNPTLNRNHFHGVKVALPSLEEQYTIATALQACDAKIAALEKEIALHEELFHALLDELMTGRLSALPLVE